MTEARRANSVYPGDYCMYRHNLKLRGSIWPLGWFLSSKTPEFQEVGSAKLGQVALADSIVRCSSIQCPSVNTHMCFEYMPINSVNILSALE